jgi:hypothetical protein
MPKSENFLSKTGVNSLKDGSLRIEHHGDSTYINDGSEFFIKLVGDVELTANDFLFY